MLGKTLPRDTFVFVAILLAALALRLILLDDAPPGLRYDEVQNYVMVKRVLSGDRPLYFAESWGHEPLYHYVQALALSIAGESDWALRLPSVFFGLLKVIATGLLARKLFGRPSGIIASSLAAISFWAIFYDRVGLRVGTTATFACFMAYFLWCGLERPITQIRHATLELLLAGVCMAAMFYVYIAGRVGLGILVTYSLYLAVVHRSRFKTVWLRLSVIAMSGIALIFPLAWHLVQQPAQQQRLEQLGAPLAALRSGEPLPVLKLVWQALGVYFVRGEQDWLYNAYGRPVFWYPIAVFFVVGIVIVFWRWKRPAYALVGLWLLVGTLPAMVAPPAASMTHTIVAQPASLIVATLGLVAFWRFLENRRHRLGWLVVIGLVSLSGAISIRDYFGTWVNQPKVQILYQGGITAVADAYSTGSLGTTVSVGSPYVDFWNPWNIVAFDLATSRNSDHVRWFNPSGGWIWPGDPDEGIIFFPNDPLGQQLYHPALKRIFDADATPLLTSDKRFTAFRVINPRQLEKTIDLFALESDLAWPAQLEQETAPKLPLIFQERLALLAVEPLEWSVDSGATVEHITFWEVLKSDPSPVVSFTHLTSDGLDIWGQQDWLDIQMAGLQPGDRFAQVHRIPVRDDTPPGQYYIQMGLYRPDTMVRLLIETKATKMADRIWLGTVIVGE